MEMTYGPFTFSSKFECGNLAKVLPVSSEDSCESSVQNIKFSSHKGNGQAGCNSLNYEFDLWTRPDCAGTEHENNNRTWFFFSVYGGTPGQHVKLVVMNLNRQMKLFSQGMLPVFQYSNNELPHSKWERIKEKCSYRSEDGCTIISWIHTVPSANTWTFYAFTYPYLYTELQSLLDTTELHCTMNNRIYYHRELLIESLDGNKLDMITITSMLGKLETREDPLPKLFPEWSTPRCHAFTGKKFVILSARVHPGETSSSFVMKGFINFIVSEDPRAARLRDLFVFKLVPMLNPDGVVRGHYRSDQRGINLNRVYDKPSLDLHPTIYAMRQIVRYYHLGANLNAFMEIFSKENDVMTTKKMEFRPPLLDEDTCHSFSDAVKKSTSTQHTLKPCLMEPDEPSASGWDVSSNVSTESFAVGQQLNQSDIQDECSYISGISENETGVTNMFDSLSPLRDFHSIDILPPQPTYQKSPFSVNPLTKSKLYSVPKNKEASEEDDQSSLYMYVDLHGHASKRGIFIFGNWFADSNMMVENMLFAKLLSLNCLNFDFSACNFSEKNMYGKDRKDGTSKEGSGRVAVMRATGVVRSYTLECNYNTGRTCNLLPASPLSNRKAHNLANPPKYTPSIFEDCGRQLGVSILDLMDCNDWSRIPQSQYSNLDVIRSYLHHMLSQSPRGSPHAPQISGSLCVPKEPCIPSTSSYMPKTRPKLGRLKNRGRRSWSLSVDSENLEPDKSLKSNSVGTRSKSRSLMKPITKKMVSRALTFTDLEPAYSCVVSDSHTLTSSVTITPTLNVELTVPDTNLPKKLQKKTRKALGTKKLKTTATTSSDFYKYDDIVPIPLSPRSPLASVGQAQTSTGKLAKKSQKKKVFQSKSLNKSDRKTKVDKLPSVTRKVKVHKKKPDEPPEVDITPVNWLIQTFPKTKKGKKEKPRKPL